MESYIGEEKYEVKLKRIKDITEELVANIYYIKDSKWLIKGLETFQEKNPNKQTIKNCDIATLFSEFIDFYVKSTPN